MSDPFRVVMTPLTDDQKNLVSELKTIGNHVYDILDTHTSGDTDRRLVDNAKNALEIAVMLAVKVVTGP